MWSGFPSHILFGHLNKYFNPSWLLKFSAGHSYTKIYSVPSLTSAEIFQIYTQQMQDENLA